MSPQILSISSFHAGEPVGEVFLKLFGRKVEVVRPHLLHEGVRTAWPGSAPQLQDHREESLRYWDHHACERTNAKKSELLSLGLYLNPASMKTKSCQS